MHARDKGAVEVTNLHVSEAQRGNGIGKMLLASAARAGQQFGKSKVTLAAQDSGSGHLKEWYKEMGFAQTGVNHRGYSQLEAPISRLVATAAQRRVAWRSPGTLQAIAINSAVSPPPTRFGTAAVGRAASVLQRMERIDDDLDVPKPIAYQQPGTSSGGKDKVSVHIWMPIGNLEFLGSVFGVGHAAIELTKSDGRVLYITWMADGRPLLSKEGKLEFTRPRYDELGKGMDYESDQVNMLSFFKHAEPSATIELPTSPPNKYGVSTRDIEAFWNEQLLKGEYSFFSTKSNCTGVVWEALKAGGLGGYHNIGDSWFIQGARDLLKAVKKAKKRIELSNEEDVFLNEQKKTPTLTSRGVPQSLPHPKPLPQPPRRRKPLPPLPRRG